MWDNEKPKRKNGEFSWTRALFGTLIVTLLFVGVGFVGDVAFTYIAPHNTQMLSLKKDGIGTTAQLVNKAQNTKCGCTYYQLFYEYLLPGDPSGTLYSFHEDVPQAVYDVAVIGTVEDILMTRDYKVVATKSLALTYTPTIYPLFSILIGLIGLICAIFYWRYRWAKAHAVIVNRNTPDWISMAKYN